MLSANNPHIDTDSLERKLEAIIDEAGDAQPIVSAAPSAIHFPQETPAIVVSVDEAPVSMLMDDPAMPSNQSNTPGPQVENVAKPAGRSILKSAVKWIKNVLRLNARLYGIGARQDAMQQIVESLAVRQQQEHEALQSMLNALHSSLITQQSSLDALQGKAMEGEARLNALEALRLGPRLAQFDHANIANRLNRLDVLDISNRLNGFDVINIANRLSQFDAVLQDLHQRNLERDNRVAALLQTFATMPKVHASADAVVPAAASFGNAELDRFYLEFEGLFRGAPADIRERLSVYLPYVEALANEPDARLVDVGCGRGEWLELMRDSGIRAIGIDMNLAMVDMCRTRGLDVECTDAIAWLRQQPAGSVAVVTGFHLIEHLPFATLLELFDAALHALRPDGVLIFETPNPENLVVGACHFYYDPTHRNPIVPAVAEFIARQRGFAEAEIKRLNAYPESYLLPEDTEIARRINRAFYGPQDFAVIARKSHAD